jgi:hypothetical protein
MVAADRLAELRRDVIRRFIHFGRIDADRRGRCNRLPNPHGKRVGALRQRTEHVRQVGFGPGLEQIVKIDNPGSGDHPQIV